MKNKKILFATLGIALLALSSCGGGGGDKPVSDENTINVKLMLGGYGSNWLSEVIKKFEAVYSNEGYKINLLTPNKQITGNQVYADLLSGYKKKNIDLYFTGSLIPSRVAGEDGILVQQIDDTVYNQKAIGFDGKEESKTVREKLDPSFTEDWYKYDGKSYNFFYQRSIGGLVVNFDKLQKCGFNYVPTTTDQLFDMVHTITSEEKRVRPFAYVKNTGYAGAALDDWFVQLAGTDKWAEFLSMNNADGTYNLTDGYKVFGYDEWIDCGEKVFNMFDYNNFVKGSKEYDIPRAHASIMTDYEDGGAVFLFDGDWALMETATDYPDEKDLQKLRFINVPVNSSLGTKLWGPGTDANITDAKKVDNILAKTCLMCDEKKTIAEIKTAISTEFSVTLTDESIKSACAARGVYFNRGVETGNAYIPVGLSAKHLDIATKLLRMIASDDFSKLYFKTAKCFSPYSSVIESGETLLPFSLGHSQIATNPYALGILPQYTGLRKAIGGTLARFFPHLTGNGYYHDVALSSEITAYNDQGVYDPSKANLYTNQAQSESDKAVQHCKDNWTQWTEPFRK